MGPALTLRGLLLKLLLVIGVAAVATAAVSVAWTAWVRAASDAGTRKPR